MIPTTDIAALALRQDRIGEFSARIRAGESGSTKQDSGPPVQVSGGVAFVGLRGFIVARPSWLTALGFATSSMQLAQAIRAAVANSKVRAIVVDCDSPGGMVLGTDEAAAAIVKLRGDKPLLCVAQGMCCSAAYWLASSCDKILASPSSDVGSIGVFSVHENIAGALEKEGVEVTLISSTPQKVQGNPFEPLTDDARKEIENRVADIYQEFLSRVAVNRGTSVSAVRAGYGKGSSFRGKAALGMGMVDGLIDDMGAAVNRYLGPMGAFAATVRTDYDAQCDICAAAGFPYVQRQSTPLAPAVSRARKPAAKGHGDPGTMLRELKMKELEYKMSHT